MLKVLCFGQSPLPELGDPQPSSSAECGSGAGDPHPTVTRGHWAKALQGQGRPCLLRLVHQPFLSAASCASQ